MHHKENSMVEVLQNSINAAQILSWQLQKTNPQWSRFPAGITHCNVTKLRASSLEFGWGWWSSCLLGPSALRSILQGCPGLDTLLFTVLFLSVLTFALCTELQCFEFCSVSAGTQFGFVYQPLSVKSNISLLSKQVKTSVLPKVPECVSTRSVFVP